MSRATLRTGLLGFALASLAVIGLMAPSDASAQAVSGTILGTVKDTSGAVMPGATVTVTNTGTGFSRSVVTDTNGEYNAPSVPTGTYSVTAEITGFKKVSKTNIHVGVDQRVRIDVGLEIGAMEEVIEIQAETPLLNTASSDLGQTVVEEQIKALPLNGRNFVSLTRTIPGVLRGIPGANIDGAGSLAWRASAAFSAIGQRPRDNNYMLDGVDNNETWLQTVVIFPSVDALDEFKLQTSTYSAEFGRSLGGVVNLQIKSGTNDFHGSVFEFLRNDAFDANNWFNNRANIAKAALQPAPVRGDLRRPDHQGQDVLLRRLPGPAHRGQARPTCRPCRRSGCATGTSRSSTGRSTIRPPASPSRATSSRRTARIRRPGTSSRSSTPSRTRPAPRRRAGRTSTTT